MTDALQAEIERLRSALEEINRRTDSEDIARIAHDALFRPREPVRIQSALRFARAGKAAPGTRRRSRLSRAEVLALLERNRPMSPGQKQAQARLEALDVDLDALVDRLDTDASQSDA